MIAIQTGTVHPVSLGKVGERTSVASPAVDPFLVAFDEHPESGSGSHATERAFVALVVAVQVGWIAALAYAVYVFFA